MLQRTSLLFWSRELSSERLPRSSTDALKACRDIPVAACEAIKATSPTGPVSMLGLIYSQGSVGTEYHGIAKVWKTTERAFLIDRHPFEKKAEITKFG